MTISNISWIYEPDESPAFHLPPDEAFVRILGQHANLAIERLDGRLCDHVQVSGFILLNSFHPCNAIEACAPEFRSSVAARAIALDVSPSRIFARVLDALRPAAAVDVQSHVEWTRSPTVPGRSCGLYGIREIGAMIGASCDATGSPSERYAYLTSTTHAGLPHLLADYLSALEDSRRSAA